MHPTAGQTFGSPPRTAWSEMASSSTMLVAANGADADRRVGAVGGCTGWPIAMAEHEDQ